MVDEPKKKEVWLNSGAGVQLQEDLRVVCTLPAAVSIPWPALCG